MIKDAITKVDSTAENYLPKPHKRDELLKNSQNLYRCNY